MHYDIKYDTASPDAPAKALKDCEAFLGRKQFLKVVRILKQSGPASPLRQRFIEMSLSLQGIQGYPATVLVDTYVEKVESDGL